MSAKWNMIVDVAKCENCQNCFIATKDEHVGNDFPGYAAPQPLHGHQWIDIRRQERGELPIIDVHFMPVMCNHCDDAPCMTAAKNGAVYKRPDGIVIVDPEKAKGQRQIVDACPYDAIFWNEELQLPQKWIFDAHLLDDGWKRTRAEQVCPTGVFRSVKVTDEEMKQIADREELRVLEPEFNTRPRVYYRNLHLMDSCFIAGTVVYRDSGREECLSGAKITLSKNDQAIATMTSDSFGEFKIDMLDENSGEYEVMIEADGRRGASRTVTLGQSLYIGTIELIG
jgi:Fe-S-cluster-containing dehydrogenase component